MADHTTKALVKELKLISVIDHFIQNHIFFLGNNRPGLSQNYPNGAPFHQNFGNTPYYPGAGGCKFISKIKQKKNVTNLICIIIISNSSPINNN